MKGGAASPYGDFKGHLGLRSSPLSPTSSKLTSQYIVLDHLNAHYRMINNAKSAIDNKTPKAWVSSTKARDRARRTGVKKSGTRSTPNTRPGSRMSAGSRQSYVDHLQDYQDYFDDDPEVGAIVKSTLPQQHSQPHLDVYIERANTDDMKFVNKIVDDTYNNPNVYKSPRPMKSMIPDTVKAGSGNPAVTTPRKGVAGDLLDDHSHKFKEGRPFTPRTLNYNKNVQSKLSQFKYYRPPKKTQTGSKSASENKGEKLEKTETMMTMATTQDLTFEPLRSKDFNQLSSQREKSANIPRLDISVDQDHLMWLSEQAKKAQVRSTSARQKPDAEEKDEMATLNQTGGLRNANTLRSSGTYRSGVKANELVTASDTLQSHRSLGMSHTMQKVDNEEEELQYLEFVSEITNDILERGIFTNRVLKQVFETNIEKRKGELKISRMRALLDKLREDLGIPESDGEGEEDFGLKSHVKLSDEKYHNELAKPSAKNYKIEPKKSNVKVSDRNYTIESRKGKMKASKENYGVAPVGPNPQTRNKFVKVTDEVDYKSLSGSEAKSEPQVKVPEKKTTEMILAENVRLINAAQSQNEADEVEDELTESEAPSMVSETNGSHADDDLSTGRSLPQEHKWMKNAANFTMTLKPGQLDMTLVKPKPRSRQRYAETVPANPRARRREQARRNGDNADDDVVTFENSNAVESVPVVDDVITVEKSNTVESAPVVSVVDEVITVEKCEVVESVPVDYFAGSDGTLKHESGRSTPKGSVHGSNASLKGSQVGSPGGSVKGSRSGSPHGSSASLRSRAKGSPRGSAHGSNAYLKNGPFATGRDSEHDYEASEHGSVHSGSRASSKGSGKRRIRPQVSDDSERESEHGSGRSEPRASSKVSEGRQKVRTGDRVPSYGSDFEDDHSENGSAHGSHASLRASDRAVEPRAGARPSESSGHGTEPSDLGSTGTLKGSLVGSTTYITDNIQVLKISDSPLPSPRGSQKSTPRSRRRDSQASGGHDSPGSRRIESVGDEGSVFSDHVTGLDSDKEGSAKATRPVPKARYSKPKPNYDYSDDDDF